MRMPGRALRHDALAALAILLALAPPLVSGEEAPPLVSGEEAAPVAAPGLSESAPRRDGRFQNNYVDFAPRGLGALLTWKLEALRDGLPPEPQSATWLG